MDSWSSSPRPFAHGAATGGRVRAGRPGGAAQGRAHAAADRRDGPGTEGKEGLTGRRSERTKEGESTKNRRSGP